MTIIEAVQVLKGLSKTISIDDYGKPLNDSWQLKTIRDGQLLFSDDLAGDVADAFVTLQKYAEQKVRGKSDKDV